MKGLDLSGMRCPVPVSRTREKLAELDEGEELKIIVDNKESCASLPLIIEEYECKIIEFRKKESKDGEKYEFLIKKL